MATKTDLLGNPENPNPTTLGFKLPGFGPRDVGAFEYEPIGTTANPCGRRELPRGHHLARPRWRQQANGSTLYVSPPPTSVIVDFSQPVNEATVQATDLILSGSDINSLSPVKATSVTWLDNHTARFNLTGQFNPVGTVNVSLVPGAIKSVSGQAVAPYADKVVLNSPQPAPTPTPAPTPSPSPTPVPHPHTCHPRRPHRRPAPHRHP